MMMASGFLRPAGPRGALFAALLLGAPVALAAPDLSVTRVATPETATLGSPVRVEVTLRNAGTVTLANWEFGLHLSPDNAVSYFDRRLAVFTGPTLAPGEQIVQTVTTTMPGDVVVGRYTMGVIADPM